MRSWLPSVPRGSPKCASRMAGWWSGSNSRPRAPWDYSKPAVRRVHEVVAAPRGGVPRFTLRRSVGAAAVVEVPAPQVAGQRDPDAPGDGGDRVRPGAGTAEQSAHRLGDGGEGLVFGELAQPGRHGRGEYEAAAE